MATCAAHHASTRRSIPCPKRGVCHPRCKARSRCVATWHRVRCPAAAVAARAASEGAWRSTPVRTHTRLLSRPTTDDTSIAPVPPRTSAEPPSPAKDRTSTRSSHADHPTLSTRECPLAQGAWLVPPRMEMPLDLVWGRGGRCDISGNGRVRGCMGSRELVGEGVSMGCRALRGSFTDRELYTAKSTDEGERVSGDPIQRASGPAKSLVALEWHLHLAPGSMAMPGIPV